MKFVDAFPVNASTGGLCPCKFSVTTPCYLNNKFGKQLSHRTCQLIMRIEINIFDVFENTPYVKLRYCGNGNLDVLQKWEPRCAAAHFFSAYK